MNLDERIESAIKPEIENWHTEHSLVVYRQKYEMAGQLIEFQDGFEKGYRAAMRSLYVEVKPEDVRGGVDYWAVLDGKWIPVWWFSDEYARKQAGDCEAIVHADIPSPAEIF